MHERFERLKAESQIVGVFSDVTLCQMVNKSKYGRFEGTTILLNVGNYQTTGHDMAGGFHLLYIYIYIAIYIATRNRPLPQ